MILARFGRSDGAIGLERVQRASLLGCDVNGCDASDWRDRVDGLKVHCTKRSKSIDMLDCR